MNIFTNRVPSISSKAFCYLQWVWLALFASSALLDPALKISAAQTWQIGSCLLALAILSYVFPIDRPLWQRLGYLCLGFLFILPTKLIGISLDLFIYLYIAKSYFLLQRYQLIGGVILVGLTHLMLCVFALPAFVQTQPALWSSIDPYNTTVIQSILLNNLLIYVVSSSFTILFCAIAQSEQNNRQQAEQLAREVEILAADLERSRIAREIHDSLGHTLTNLQIQLNVAQKLRTYNLDKTFQAIDLSKQLADRCIEDVSHSLQVMRHSKFDFNRAIQVLVEQIQQNASVRVKLRIRLPELSSPMSYQIYCILKEGLINIQKHARANQVWLECGTTSEGIFLELGDDGEGFEPTAVQSGFGLKGMKERVHLLGGQLQICSNSGIGTCIHIVLPI